MEKQRLAENEVEATHENLGIENYEAEFRRTSFGGLVVDRTLGHWRDEAGAVTVDFVVLVAAGLSLAVLAAGLVGSAVSTHADRTSACMVKQQKLMAKNNLGYQQKLKRMKRQCGKV